MEEPQGPGEKGSLAFFGAWLLLHEKADDWIRDALRRARERLAIVCLGHHQHARRFLADLKALAADVLGQAVGVAEDGDVKRRRGRSAQDVQALHDLHSPSGEDHDVLADSLDVGETNRTVFDTPSGVAYRCGEDRLDSLA